MDGISLRRVALGLAGVALSCTSALAGTITYTTSVGPNTTDWASILALPQFHPGSGTLNSVSLFLQGAVTGTLQLSNTGTFTDIATQLSATPGTPSSFSGTGGTGTKTISGLSAAVTSKLFVGETITANKGIAAGTTVTSIGATSITISKNITLSGAKTITPVCSATMCSDWALKYHAATPLTVPTDTIHSNLSANLTLHAGADTIALAPSVASTDTLEYGPKYSPSAYDFNDTYSGTPLTLAAVQALAPPNGIPAPSGAETNPCALSLYSDCMVDGHVYHTGVSHSGLSDTDSGSLFYTAPADLTMYIGGGNVSFPIDAFGASGTDGGGNISFLSSTNVSAALTLTYDYTPPARTDAVPEPGSVAMFGGGLLGLALLRSRKLGLH